MRKCNRTAGNLGRILPLALIGGAVITIPIAGTASADGMDSIRVGGQYPPIFEYVYRHHVIEAGIMEDYGLDAEFVGFTAGLDTTQALAAGSIDIGCDGMSGILSAIEQGANITVVLSPNADNTYVIVARDEIESPADIEGRTWAISSMGAISQTYAAMWLDHYEIESVDWVPIGGTGDRSRALIAGQVDAALLTVGRWLEIEDEPGIHLMEYLADVVPPLPLSLCAANQSLIDDRPDIVQRYVDSTMDAIRHARTPEGHAEYVESAKMHDEGAISDELYEELIRVYLSSEGNAFAIDPNGGLYPEVFIGNMKSMIADGTLDEQLPLEQVWDPRFVNNYIGENGWFDVTTSTSGNYLRDMIRD